MVYQYIIDRMLEEEIKAFKYNSINPNRIVMSDEVFTHMQKWEDFSKYYKEPDSITTHWPTYRGLHLLVVSSTSIQVDAFVCLAAASGKLNASRP